MNHRSKTIKKITEELYLREQIFEGRGRFPMDMLRYDNCYPSMQIDAININISMRPAIRDQDDDITPIHISVRSVRIKDHDFTFDRWESFGWKPV